MKQYGLIGKSLSHSFSKHYFSEKFKHLGIDAEYVNIELEDIADVTQMLLAYPLLQGINVTIPYKSSIIPYLHQLQPEVIKINAVNCIKIIREGSTYQLHGYNTDYIGIIESIKKLDVSSNLQALILGNGGASKAVQYALSVLDIPFMLATRTAQFGLHFDEISKEIVHDFKLIINTTPLGTSPNIQEIPPIPIEYISEHHKVFDLVYNPAETLLIKEAKKRGAETLNGQLMLQVQAEASWNIWST